MNNLPWMKFWILPFKAGTGHLTKAEKGCYMDLLCEAWDTPTCSLPADPAWIRRRLCVSVEEYDESVRPVLDEFWTEEDHRIFQKRQREEWKLALHNSEAGKAAANVRWSGRKVIPLKTKEGT